MMKAGRHITFYILLTVIQVQSRKDPVNLKLIKMLSRNENPLMVYELKDSEVKGPHNFIKDLDGDESDGNKGYIVYLHERNKPNSAIKLYNKDTGNNNAKMLVKLLANFDNLNDEDDDKKNHIDDLLEDEEEQTLEETAKERAKYLFYNFLRTSPDEDSDLQDTRHFLREALRSRCTKVTTCVQKCKVTKPKCPTKCQEILDEQNLCEPPKEKKCKKTSCWGKTMPPRWLL